MKNKGGLLVGKTDKNDGEGIEVIAPEGKIIAGGGEIIINEEASKKHCEELSKINQSTGGVAIPCDVQIDKAEKGKELKSGIEIEKEHENLYNELSDRLKAEGVKMPMSKQEFFKTIAEAHLKEKEDYYQLLKKYVEAEKGVKIKNSMENYYLKIGNIIKEGNKSIKILGFDKDGLIVADHSLILKNQEETGIDFKTFVRYMDERLISIEGCVYENERDKILLNNEIKNIELSHTNKHLINKAEILENKAEELMVKKISKSGKASKLKKDLKEKDKSTKATIEAMEAMGDIEKAEKGTKVSSKEFIESSKELHNSIKEVVLKDGTRIPGKKLMNKGGKSKIQKYIVFYVSKESGGMRERIFDTETEAHEFSKEVSGSVTPIKMSSGGKIKSIKKVKNFYHVRLHSPKGAVKCAVPEWGQTLAESVHENAKITTCQDADKNWHVQNIMIPVEGVSKKQAKEYSEKIADKINKK